MNRPIYRRFFTFAFAILVVIMGSSFAFVKSEGIGWLDAVWYSIMTVTTVGYEAPPQISDTGKIISIVVMLFGVGTVLYVLTGLALDLFSGEYFKEYKQIQINKKMKSLENHFIICGFGRNGRQAARKLQLHRRPFVMIDKNSDQRKFDTEFSENAIFLQGNAIEDEVLKKAGVEKAAGIIAALPSDADNLFIVVTARQINKSLKIISRASNSNTVTKLKSAGADNVIMPDKIGGEHMASLLLTPDLVEFMDHIALEGTKNINLLEIYTNRIDSSFLGKNIADLEIKNQSGCKVIGYKKQDNTYIINPNDQKTIEPNSCIIVLGKPEQIMALKQFLKF